jgi:thiamine biosynthesis protein ThiI
MHERVCLVGYHELGLKGRNRSVFERRLRDNLDAALVGMPAQKSIRRAGRIEVPLSDQSAMETVARRIAKVPGVAYVAPAIKIGQEPADMQDAAVEMLRAAPKWTTFRVQTKRSNTDHPETSMDINRRVGSYVLEHLGGKVDLTSPDVTVSLTVSQSSTYVFASKIPGAGGLPVGTAGKVISLLSAGIDSPVATWRIIRRGATAVGVHFSGRPHASSDSERLVVEIGETLALTGGLGRIYIVAFGELQKEIALLVPPDLRVIMYRRMMIKVAERIARTERAKALVTGESLGQVASQTLENMAAVDEAATLPVLRPLAGSDKQEIIKEAKEIETYESSISAHDDCCTLFMPRTPETHARMRAVLDAWSVLDVERMVDDALATLTWRDFPGGSYRSPRPWHTPSGELSWGVALTAEHEPPAPPAKPDTTDVRDG